MCDFLGADSRRTYLCTKTINNNDTDNTDHTAGRGDDPADDQPANRDHPAGDGTTARADGTADEPTANG